MITKFFLSSVKDRRGCLELFRRFRETGGKIVIDLSRLRRPKIELTECLELMKLGYDFRLSRAGETDRGCRLWRVLEACRVQGLTLSEYLLSNDEFAALSPAEKGARTRKANEQQNGGDQGEGA